MRHAAASPEETSTTGLSREQRHRGARVVASFASDAGDRASLLAALGLEAAEPSLCGTPVGSCPVPPPEIEASS
ncbi:Uncharacterised protein [Amycolatopsis camponoti]|uniref:Uncharacterized protein n=1 Tax=Amycolatopsis camponoti TaxID=2606593 RepID=A0A6I8LXM5_9PSEU|nr:Uncharacterised protein [Amycolatopsis camponoti]